MILPETVRSSHKKWVNFNNVNRMTVTQLIKTSYEGLFFTVPSDIGSARILIRGGLFSPFMFKSVVLIVVLIVALCKVGDKFNLQRGKVGVGKSSHGGVRVCALSGLSFSVGVACGNNVGLVFSSTRGVISVSS
jgi:hypothetical protein